MKEIKEKAEKFSKSILATRLGTLAMLEETYLAGYKEAIYKSVEIARSYQDFDYDTSMHIAKELLTICSTSKKRKE